MSMPSDRDVLMCGYAEICIGINILSQARSKVGGLLSDEARHQIRDAMELLWQYQDAVREAAFEASPTHRSKS